ncbi:unnamed protein product [Sphagnum jensenii]|uniref:Uncharacterized protein n=1 Tax=Sphagnum jensenii TaxID=128206 RepID=A0ABP1BMT1_9BRYO
MRDNASVSREPSITFFETDLLLLDPENLFLSVNPKSLFQIRSMTIILFLSVNPKSLFQIRSMTIILFLSVNPKSLFRIRSVTLILFLSMNPKSLSRIRSVSLIFFRAPIFEFRNQYPVLTRNSFNLGLRDVLVLLVLSRHGCPSLAVS